MDKISYSNLGWLALALAGGFILGFAYALILIGHHT